MADELQVEALGRQAGDDATEASIAVPSFVTVSASRARHLGHARNTVYARMKAYGLAGRAGGHHLGGRTHRRHRGIKSLAGPRRRHACAGKRAS
jgi:hypothetical protein